MPSWMNLCLQTLERWIEYISANIKLVDQALTGMEGSYVELLTLLAIGLLAAMPVIVPVRGRQIFRHLAQCMGILIFIFVVYTCMGVFGMVRNFFRGMSEIGQENIMALYFCSVPVTIMATSLIFGSTFCGWMCPTGALQEFVSLLVRRWQNSRRAGGWRFSHIAFWLSMLSAVLFLLGVWYLARNRIFFVEDSSIYWAEVLLILQFLLLWKMSKWDYPLRRLRRLSFWLIVLTAIAGWWITSPVHLVFTKVYDPGSLLSTVLVAFGALVVPNLWCRYLCPWREVMAWAAKHSVRILETIPGRCTHCGKCEKVCRVDAIQHGVVDLHECHMCLSCVDSCPSGAICFCEQWGPKESKAK